MRGLFKLVGCQINWTYIYIYNKFSKEFSDKSTIALSFSELILIPASQTHTYFIQQTLY